MKKIALLFVLFVLCASGFSVAYAHEDSPGESVVEVETTLQGQGTSVLEFESLSSKLVGIGLPDKLDQLKVSTEHYQKEFAVSYKGNICSANVSDYPVEGDGQTTRFKGTYTCSESVNSLEGLTVKSVIFGDLFPEYEHFVTLKIGEEKEEVVFTRDNSTYPSLRDDYLFLFKKYVALGVEHVFGGLDHVLFLIAIVLLLSSAKEILLLVTSFTVAHSLTLILGGLKLVSVTPSFVEPVIALSIAYIAFQNTRYLNQEGHHGRFKEKWTVIFGFGLVHGLGFAGSLATTELPQGFFLGSLLSFNVGVELGQLLILLILLPWLRLMIVEKWKHRKNILMTTSQLILAISLVWFVERIVSVFA